jgi:thiol:disulfide interchange protein DsbD
MNYILRAFIFFFLIGSIASAQIHKPVIWETSVEKINESEFNLVVSATIEAGWHLYSQNVPEGGPIATSIVLNDESENFQLIGNPIEDKGIEEFDNVFNMKIKFFEKKASFKQKIRLLTEEKITIEGIVEFMVCDDTFCLPPTEVDLSFEVQGKAGAPVAESVSEVKEKSFLQNTQLDQETEDKSQAGDQKIVGRTKQDQGRWYSQCNSLRCLYSHIICLFGYCGDLLLRSRLT